MVPARSQADEAYPALRAVRSRGGGHVPHRGRAAGDRGGPGLHLGATRARGTSPWSHVDARGRPLALLGGAARIPWSSDWARRLSRAPRAFPWRGSSRGPICRAKGCWRSLPPSRSSFLRSSGAVAWILLAAPRIGAFNYPFRALMGLEPLNVYTLTGISWVIGIYLAPYVMMIVAAALRSMDPSLEEAAQVSGPQPLADGRYGHPAACGARDPFRCGAGLHHHDRTVWNARGDRVGAAALFHHLAHLSGLAGSAARVRRHGRACHLPDTAVAAGHDAAAVADQGTIIRYRFRQGLPGSANSPRAGSMARRRLRLALLLLHHHRAGHRPGRGGLLDLHLVGPLHVGELRVSVDLARTFASRCRTAC